MGRDTSDSDLVELAGYHSYKHYEKDSKFKVNDKKYVVNDTQYDTASGLDALTVKNIESDELTVVFVGSEQLQEDWLDTNTKLLSDMEPEQLIDAKKYFNHVNRDIGEVSSVTGNSLGGALTNAVAVKNPDVKAVTYNPAILPKGMVDSDKDYTNVTNYYGEYDPLTLAEEGIDMGDRIPGSHYTIHSGLPLPSLMGSNHTGYVDKDDNGEFTVEVGEKGKPGHGFIYDGAGDHVATSLLTGESLYGGKSNKVDINKENVMTLADGLKSLATERMSHATSYLGHSDDIVKNEGKRLNDRISTMQEVFERLIHEAAGTSLFKGITRTGDALFSCVDWLIKLLNQAEDKCRFLNSILNSKPAELVESVTSTNISVESLFAPPKTYLQDIDDHIENLVSNARLFVNKRIPKLLADQFDQFDDAVVDELKAHYHIVSNNQQKLSTQLTNYEQQIRGVGKAFDQLDTHLADSIEAKSDPGNKVNHIPETELVTLESSPYLKDKDKLKEAQVDYAYHDLKKLTDKLLMPIVLILKNLVYGLELALDAILETIETAKNVVLYGNPVGSVLSLFTSFDQKVRDAAQEVKKPIDDMQSTVHGIHKGLKGLHKNLPEAIEEFKPYLDTATFKTGDYENVHLYNVATRAIFSEMEMQFSDIINQLTNEKAGAIHSAINVSVNVRRNLHVINRQMERAIVE